MSLKELLIKYVVSYIKTNYSEEDYAVIEYEIEQILGVLFSDSINESERFSYDELQHFLSTVNEKELNQKEKGVYYTPSDVVHYIVKSVSQQLFDVFGGNYVKDSQLEIPYKSFCFEKKAFDPTCGAGEFLISILETKLQLYDSKVSKPKKESIDCIVATIFGNDLNPNSTDITKLRLFFSVLHRYGALMTKGLSKILNTNFENYDYVSNVKHYSGGFDIIIGNPPYVEDAKSGLIPEIRYGNIYANVLDNSLRNLRENGVVGYVIPLSYISTPRMSKIRNLLREQLAEQYIVSFSDRPDCLFSCVHQKLCILLGKKKEHLGNSIFTSHYSYWYRVERKQLFESISFIKNRFIGDSHIPKIGTEQEDLIYEKIRTQPIILKSMIIPTGKNKLYLNMRATFWIKAFNSFHKEAEYKELSFDNEINAAYVFCLLNSSLFWWYWISTSDCWHITNKELSGFRIPAQFDSQIVLKLSKALEKKLEETKRFVGSVQTEYEYKHKECLKEIHDIDDYINKLFRLSLEESELIKSFALKYRTSGGSHDSN